MGRCAMSDKVQESLIILGGTGNLGTEVLPILADAGYHLVVFSRSQVSGAPFDHPGVTVSVGSLDDPEFIDSLVTTALQHADKLDRKSTRLNSSHVATSYAVSCLTNKRQ